MKEKKLLLKEKEIEEKARHREMILDGQEKQESGRDGIRSMLEEIKNRLEQQERKIEEIINNQKHQQQILKK